jgi:hypothetical protein
MNEKGEFRKRIFQIFWDEHIDGLPYEKVCAVLDEFFRELKKMDSQGDLNYRERLEVLLKTWFGRDFGEDVIRK